MWRVILRLIGICFGVTFVALLALVVTYKYVPVTNTPFMKEMAHKSGVTSISQKWVSLDDISPEMALAVVSSEDNRFVKHNGFEWEAIKKAHEKNKSGKSKSLHGASTISQQTAKNVFLWNGRSWIRKGLEAGVTVLIEAIWGKRRIMEVYLNVIEIAPGVHGVEAASQKFFHHSAKKLTRNEAALIAAVLPNPCRFSVAKPSAYTRKRQADIATLMSKIGKVRYP